MAADLIFTTEAEQDLTEAGDWHENQRRGRGARLLARVADTIAAVRRTPKAFTALRGEYRKAPVYRFPYVVVYRHDGEAGVVTVYAVFHTSQNPEKLLERLPRDQP
jgi:plasmid stabilization system protein ParE